MCLGDSWTCMWQQCHYMWGCGCASKGTECNTVKKDKMKMSQGSDVGENFSIQGTLRDIAGYLKH